MPPAAGVFPAAPTDARVLEFLNDVPASRLDITVSIWDPILPDSV